MPTVDIENANTVGMVSSLSALWLPGLSYRCTVPRVETSSYRTVQKRLETDHPIESYVCFHASGCFQGYPQSVQLASPGSFPLDGNNEAGEPRGRLTRLVWWEDLLFFPLVVLRFWIQCSMYASLPRMLTLKASKLLLLDYPACSFLNSG